MKKFDELIEKAVPWFIAVCLALILWAVTSCHPYPYKSIKPDKTKHATFR